MRLVLVLVCALALQGFLALYFGPTYHGRDDRVYIQLAGQMVEQAWTMQNGGWIHRWAIALPTALSLRVFPGSPRAPWIWPLICSLMTTAMVWGIARKTIGNREAGVAAILLALSPIHLRQSTTLVPEPILACAMLVLAWSLYHRHRGCAWFVVAALAWWFGFVAKIAIVWTCPFVALLWVYDVFVLRYHKGRSWTPFFIVLFSGGFVLSCVYWVARGDAFSWLTTGLCYGQSRPGLASMAHEWALLQRLTYEPFIVLFSPFYAYLMFLGLAALVLLLLRNYVPPGCAGLNRENENPSFWVAFFACALAAFWFSSTSLSAYIPIKANPRYMFVFVPWLALFAGIGLVGLRDYYEDLWCMPLLVRCWWIPFLALAIYAGWVGYYGEDYIRFVGRDGAPWSPAGPNPML